MVKRIVKESEECKKEMDTSEFVKKIKAKNLYDDDIIKVGTKSMYPKTYEKLKSLGDKNQYPIGCVTMEGENLVFYTPYHGWLNLLQVYCGDEIIRIPKVSPSVNNFMRKDGNEYFLISWFIEGDSIYISGESGC
jgi:hypothetical protein